MAIDWSLFAIPKSKDGKLRVEAKRDARLSNADRDKQWRADVRARYGWKCGIPGCKEPGEHLHHIIYRSRSKALKYSAENTVPLCKAHHELEHGGKITIYPRDANGELVIVGDRKYLAFRL